jgi:O-antigen/teichoic acid export membrane protein
MKPIKQLAGQTAIYGLSSILARVLNYLLVPLYSRVFLPSEVAVYVEMYAYMAFFVVILTYGFETAFFRYSETHKSPSQVYSTTFWSIILTTTVFATLALFNTQTIASFLQYSLNPEYFVYFVLILSIDTIISIPFARLRAENKALKFAMVRVIGILVNISLNLLLLVAIPYLFKVTDSLDFRTFLSYFTDGKPNVSAIFIANLIASLVSALLLIPEVIKVKVNFSLSLWKSMFNYAFPLMVLGLAGIINETIDRVLLKYLLPSDIAMHNLGIYGMCYKIAIFISIFIQAFRYAAEPFFFAQAKEKNAPETYAMVTNYFVMTCIAISLFIMLYIQLFKYFVGYNYYEGLKVVPILLISHVFLGVFYNLSVWYKVSGKTHFGAWISIGGVMITVVLNVILIPYFGYMGSAWANFACYLFMMLASYFFGQKHNPYPYKVKEAAYYTVVAVSAFALSQLVNPSNIVFNLLYNTLLMAIFVVLVTKKNPDLVHGLKAALSSKFKKKVSQ